MGCDIYIACEYLGYKGVWKNCDHFKVNHYYNEEEGDEKYIVQDIYNDRNYEVFAMLANVRNYGEIVAFDDPRGIPSDACEYTRKRIERWDSDGHSHSYMTLAELKDYVGEYPPIKCEGYVSEDAAMQIADYPVYSGGYLTRKTEDFCVFMEWIRPNPVLPIIKALEERSAEEFYRYNEDNDDKIRIVFWFDN